MNYLYLVPLLIIFYMVAVDRNLGEYLYLKLWDEPVLRVRTAVLKYRLLLPIRYERFLMGRRVIPSRFYKMAKETRSEKN